MWYTKTNFLYQRLPGNPDGRLQFDIFLEEKEMILLEKYNQQIVYLPTSIFFCPDLFLLKLDLYWLEIYRLWFSENSRQSFLCNLTRKNNLFPIQGLILLEENEIKLWLRGTWVHEKAITKGL